MTKLRETIHKAKNVVIIGGGFIGAELINTIALSIQKKVTVRELDMIQIATF